MATNVNKDDDSNRSNADDNNDHDKSVRDLVGDVEDSDGNDRGTHG